MEKVYIVESREEYYPSYCDTLNRVARERKYLSTNTGYSLEHSNSFCRYVKRMGFPQYFAVNEREEAIGWCDIVRRDGYPSDVGFLGVGVRADYRGKGVGTKLMIIAMNRAKQLGYSTIRLECRSTNERAIELYQKLGFRKCTIQGKHIIVDGEQIPIVLMKKSI